MYRFLVFALALSFTATSVAQLVNCNGNWTNKQCDGTPLQTLPEKALDKSVATGEYKARRELSASIAAYGSELGKIGVAFPVTEITDYCFLPTTSLTECRERFESTQRLLAPSISLAQHRLDSQRPEDKTTPEPTGVQNNAATSVTIINNEYLPRKPDRHSRRPRDRTHPREVADPIDPQPHTDPPLYERPAPSKKVGGGILSMEELAQQQE